MVQIALSDARPIDLYASNHTKGERTHVTKVGLLVAKNSASNVIRGSATAAVAILLPHFLTHSLDVGRFAAWSLMLQIAAYAGYLDFGLQTAIGRFVAQATELEQWERRKHIVATAFSMLCGAGLLAAIVIGFIIWHIESLFPGIPPTLATELQKASAVVALSACLLLPLSTFTGVLIGLHRNEFPAIVIGGSRLVGALAVIVASRYTHSLIVLGLCIGVTNLLGGIIQLIIAQRMVPGIGLNPMRAKKTIAREILVFCAALTVFAVGMLLVSGLDVTILGHFRFEEVGFYSVAGLLVSFSAGLSSSVTSALISPIAALHARFDVGRIQDTVKRVTKISAFANFLITAFILLTGHFFLKLWVGSEYADRATSILGLLAIAQAIRLIGASYSAMLIATGQQSKGIQNAIAEALTNLVASIIGAALYGGIGVAWGTLIGAVVGILWIFFYTMPSAHDVPFSAWPFFKSTVALPVLCAGPAFLLLFIPRTMTPLPVITAIVSYVLCIGIAVRFHVVPRSLSLRG
jgi:O-antigen/teichoic acid export membrane protein